MAAAAVVVTSSTPQAPPVAVPITEAPDTATALRAARAQGTEVEAVSMRTSTREVFAQPDGRLKASLSTVPQRVQRDGKWSPISTELAAAGIPAETVYHHYDDLVRPSQTVGGLRDMSTDMLVNSTAYTKYGELYRLELGATGKRAWLSYYYDDNTRRMNRYIVDAEVPSPKQADVNYSYDDAGNALSVVDSTVLGSDRQCFRYDDLQRLPGFLVRRPTGIRSNTTLSAIAKPRCSTQPVVIPPEPTTTRGRTSSNP